MPVQSRCLMEQMTILMPPSIDCLYVIIGMGNDFHPFLVNIKGKTALDENTANQAKMELEAEYSQHGFTYQIEKVIQ